MDKRSEYPIIIQDKKIPFVQPYKMRFRKNKLIVEDDRQYSSTRLLIEALAVTLLKTSIDKNDYTNFKINQENLDYLGKAVDLLNFAFGLKNLKEKHHPFENRHDNYKCEEQHANDLFDDLFIDRECVISQNELVDFCSFGINKVVSCFCDKHNENPHNSLDNIATKMREFTQEFLTKLL